MSSLNPHTRTFAAQQNQPDTILNTLSNGFQFYITGLVIFCLLVIIIALNIACRIRRRNVEEAQRIARRAKSQGQGQGPQSMQRLRTGEMGPDHRLLRNPYKHHHIMYYPHFFSKSWKNLTHSSQITPSKTDDIEMAYEEETQYNNEATLAVPLYMELDKSEFDIKDKIFKGGGGEVFLGQAKTSKTAEFGEKIIVKKLGARFEELKPKHMKSFDQEVAIMTMLRNEPCIAKLIGFCREPCCLVLKYYDLGSLNKVIYNKERKWSKVLTVGIMKDVAVGIQKMHHLQMAHCDLKPHNILIEKVNGRLRGVVTDFGITNVLSNDIVSVKSFKLANPRGMTRMYASPESILRYRRRKPDEAKIMKAGDVYAIAMMIFELLLLRLPWLPPKGIIDLLGSIWIRIRPEVIVEE